MPTHGRRWPAGPSRRGRLCVGVLRYCLRFGSAGVAGLLGVVVPIDLLRLRRATVAYLAILCDAAPSLDGLAHAAMSAGTEIGKPMAELRDSVRAPVRRPLRGLRPEVFENSGLGVRIHRNTQDDAPGTSAAILNSLARLLGET